MRALEKEARRFPLWCCLSRGDGEGTVGMRPVFLAREVQVTVLSDAYLLKVFVSI